MDTLASCYFCGAALDKRLQEYPVVPDAFRDGADVTTATLCPACHQKLETVLDAVVTAADETGTEAAGALDPDTAADTATAESDSPDVTAEDHPESGMDMWESAAEDVESGADDGTDDEAEVETTESDDSEETVTADDVAELAGDIDAGILDDDDDSEADEEEEDLQSAMEADVPDAFESDASDDAEADEAVDSSEDDGSAGADDEAEDVTAADVDALAGDIDSDILDDNDDSDENEDDDLQSAMEADVPTEFQSGSGGGTTDSAGDTGDADATTGPDDTSEADDATAKVNTQTDDSAPAEEGGGEDTTTETEPTTARTSISALEYNKVMRLLQNREFPVARGEIETVAANAYDLSPAECAEVIDLAVDRGLIDEDGDQLVRPD
jgi:hypothetical protein